MLLERVVSYLSGRLSVPVATEVPEERPERMLAVGVAGGESDGFTETLRLALDAWGQSDLEAHTLLNEALEAVYDMPDELVEVVRASRATEYRSYEEGGHRVWGADAPVFANVV